mgnify:CR=1 FL=1
MGLFKNLGKTLKKAAPIIGAGIGFYFGGPVGAGLGSGIGTLAGGGSTEDALLAGALGYAGGSMAQGYLPQAGQAATKGIFAPATIGSQNPTMAAKIASSTTDPGVTQGLVGTEGGSSVLGGIGDFMSNNKMLTAGVGLGALGLLAGEEGEQVDGGIPETREGRAYQTKVKGPITGTTYNLANDDEVEAYNEELLQLREKSFKYEAGGEVNGPGTGTSDSVPARLSDGEFVLTAKAVRGAGDGDRDIGAARMYDMMAALESMA